jgi:hypothetical protein
LKFYVCFHGERVDGKGKRYTHKDFFSYYSSQDIKYVANSYVKNNLSRDLNANKVGKDVY